MKDRVKSKVALFSMYSDNIRIEEHCNNGGIAAVYENGYVLIRTGNHILPVEEVENIPITFGGKADFNIANVLAAALGAYTTGISLNKIREALKTFIPSSENTPGRANIFEFNDFTVMVDYAHNPHGVKALGNFINSFNTANKVGIITGVGDRRDEDIISLGQEAARIFNEIIIRHDEDLRGRTHEELDTLLTNGVRKVNPNIPVSYFWCECESVDYAIRTAKPDTLIVVLTDNILKVTSCIREHQEKRVNWLKKAV